MAWVIGILAVAVVLGSVMWLRPSPAQQRQVRLRLLARQLGLDVRLAPVPQTHRAKVRREDADAGVVYRLLRYDLSAPLAEDCVWVRDAGDSPWERPAAPGLTGRLATAVEEELAQLPRDVAALELTAHGPGIYWRERGDEETVKRIHAALARLLEAISAA